MYFLVVLIPVLPLALAVGFGIATITNVHDWRLLEDERSFKDPEFRKAVTYGIVCVIFVGITYYVFTNFRVHF